MILPQNLQEQQSGNKQLICIKAKIAEEIYNIDYELKAIYHSKDTVCIWDLKKEKIEINLWMILLV